MAQLKGERAANECSWDPPSALLAGRNHVIPVDIAAVAHRVLRHRIMLGFQADAQNVTPDTIIDAIVRTVRVP